MADRAVMAQAGPGTVPARAAVVPAGTNRPPDASEGGAGAGGSRPDTRITDGPPSWSGHRRVRFRFAAEAADFFECRLDDEAWSSCESPQRRRGAPGNHRIRVRASLDGADPTPADRSFRTLRR